MTLQSMSRCKVAGEDGITIDLINGGRNFVVKELAKFNLQSFKVTTNRK